MPDKGVAFQPAVTKRASEIIFDQVKSMIVQGQLKPGDRLPSEKNMMEMFQRSRPTIREALRMLERGGFIRTIAGSHGAIVLEPDNQSIQRSIEEALQIGRIDLGEMYEYRSISEAATVTWACQRRTEEDLDRMRDCLKRMVPTVNDSPAFIAIDSEFHGLIAAASKNTVSILIIQTISNMIRNFIRAKLTSMTKQEQAEMFAKGLELHEEIFRAIEAQDEERARQAMEKHLLDFKLDLNLNNV